MITAEERQDKIRKLKKQYRRLQAQLYAASQRLDARATGQALREMEPIEWELHRLENSR